MKQIICDQCGDVVKSGYRVRLDAMFKTMHANRQGYTQERRSLDFCGPTCASRYIAEHGEEAGGP